MLAANLYITVGTLIVIIHTIYILQSSKMYM